nr:FYN-binding protein 1-like [Lytechinus pictus]
MSENSVKDILAKFSQGNGPQFGGPPLAQKPSVQSKPPKVSKPNNLPVSSQSSNGVKPSPNGVKSPVSRLGFPPGGGVNIEDITKVKLKKPPLPKPPPEARQTENQVPSFKLQPKPKPKPAAPPRQEPSSPFGAAHLQPKSPSPESSIPFRNESSLHVSSKPAALAKKPKPPAPSRKDSLTKICSVPRKPSPPSVSPEEEDKENTCNWKNGIGADEPAPPISDSENSSASSITETPLRRTSFLHTVSKNLKQGNRKPVLEPLPPLSVIGNAPRKPAKPPNVSLAKYLSSSSDSLPPPVRPPKPGSTPSTPPSLPARPCGGGGLSKTRPPPPQPVPEEQIPEDAGDIYDDVEGEPSSRVPRKNRPFSLM